MNIMRNINALSLAPDVNHWLTSSRHPRILHVFDQACNLINEHTDVLSVVTPQIGNGPFNLVIESDTCFSETINLQSPVSNSHHGIIVGNITICSDGAKLWNPYANWKILHNQKEKIPARLLQLPITNYLLHGGFDTCTCARCKCMPLDDHSGLLNHQHAPITKFSNSLSSAVASADLSSSLTAAKNLAGLGMGLTPSGDDFLMGALYASWIIHPHEIASVLAKEIAETAAPLTTSLSGAWLRSAGRGEAGALWHKFFDTLIDGESVQIQAAMDKILAVGETSGADALAGFVGTFISYAESGIKLCHS